MLNGLDLFSGIGGLSFGLREWVRPIAYCENDRYAQAVLMSRMRNGFLCRAPIWDDVRTLAANQFKDMVDIIFGGFPCQDISTAGAGAGLEGERSGLFFEIIRLTRELRPRFVFLENVAAITVRGLDRVLLEFSALGYDCRWTIVSAAEMGAPHLRERWFLLAHADSNGLRLKQPWGETGEGSEQGFSWHFCAFRPMAYSDCSRKSQRSEIRHLPRDRSLDSGEKMAHTQSVGRVERAQQGGTKKANSMFRDPGKISNSDGLGLEEQGLEGKRSTDPASDSSWWQIEPDVGRVVDGVPARVDRLRGLGNAVVPAQAREAFQRLAGLKTVAQ